MYKKRFKGKMSSEYNLIALAAPQYTDCEKEIGEILKKYFHGQRSNRFEILEIGCGSGFTSEIILKADRRIHLTAVDNEPKMIGQAKRKLAKYAKAKRVKIFRADALDFVKRLKSGNFDAFASALTIHNFNFKYRRKFLLEVYRSLKPGGLFINMDRYAHDDPKVFKEWLEWQIGMYKKVFSELGEDELIEQWVKHEAYDSRPDVIMKMKPALSDMKKAGFKNSKFVYRKRTYSVLTASRAGGA
ncbi:MAG: class I SAM-dependent methyltransferase [Patescibacteria group bacterium]|nr:class I SAM-dependent methyltransferase [Patescibacteria group bacterium]